MIKVKNNKKSLITCKKAVVASWAVLVISRSIAKTTKVIVPAHYPIALLVNKLIKQRKMFRNNSQKKLTIKTT